MSIDIEYKAAVQNLVYWQQGQSFFTAKLFELMAKADVKNFAKLAMAYPAEAKAFSDWYHASNPEKFFEEVLGHVD